MADATALRAYGTRWGAAGEGTLQALWPRHVVGDNVVELGAASGRNQELLPDGIFYLGVERDPSLIELGASEGRRLIRGDLTEPSAYAAHLSGADTLLLLDVLEHLAEPETALGSIAEHLRPGTRVIISVPNIVYIGARLRIANGRFPRDACGIFDATHLRFFDLEAVNHLGLMLAPGVRVLPTRKAVNGGRLGRLPAGTAIVSAADSLSKKLCKARPTLFAYEWLLVGQAPE